MKKYIGFDIDDKKTVACVYVAEREQFRFRTLRTQLEAMREFVRREREPGDEVHLTYEVSGRSGYLYDGLVEMVDTVTVSNPTKITWIYRTETKNDRMDAKKQAVHLAVNQIPRVHMPAGEVREWRGLIGHRRKLVEGRTQCKNRLRAHFKNRGVVNPYRRGWWSQGSLKWMREAASGGGGPWHLTLEDLLEQLEWYEQRIRRVTERLDAIGGKDHRVRLLQTIPGVGPRTAEAVVAYTDGIERFRGSREYAAYFGLTPRLDESGSCRRMGHISRQGPSGVRWLLVESCWRAVRQSPSLRCFYRWVLHGQKERNKIAVVAVARKLATIIYAMLKTGEVFNEDLVAAQVAQAA